MIIENIPEIRFKPEAMRAELSSGYGEFSRLFLVDDQCLLRKKLRHLIEVERDLTVIGETSNGVEAYQKIAPLLPHLVVMDISMEGWCGLSLTERIKKDLPRVKVLAFTMLESRRHLCEIFQAGASGYLLKSSPAEEILKAIRCTLKGEAYVDPGLGATRHCSRELKAY